MVFTAVAGAVKTGVAVKRDAVRDAHQFGADRPDGVIDLGMCYNLF